MGKLIILSGPSCVGKGPLLEALRKFYPDLMANIRNLTIYNSRQPRPGERDGVEYYFRLRDDIEKFRGRDDHLVMDIRGDLQALDLEQMRRCLSKGDVFFEANPVMVDEMITRGLYDKAAAISVFLSPLSIEEIEHLKQIRPRISLPAFVTDVMRRKLLRRTTRQKSILSLPDLENIELRVANAYKEMCFAPIYDYVIPNHDGEDSENWNAFYHPIADARKTMLAFADLLHGKTPATAEHWPENLLKDLSH